MSSMKEQSVTTSDANIVPGSWPLVSCLANLRIPRPTIWCGTSKPSRDQNGLYRTVQRSKSRAKILVCEI